MVSPEGEKVHFAGTVDPAAANGNVEIWLDEVHKAMMSSLEKVVAEGIASYVRMSREIWILEFPGQAVLNVSQCYWTEEA